ncbi:S8 family peptidase [Ferviditalea candida]|uniref:S8 family peptidase n=1 Tax=Ferviditalea candida TaxID=3108399 RepID=A0ABU5ZH82_9BACL|nr:S8 family peptidase [Paenibacillaceae bacterium T2]
MNLAKLLQLLHNEIEAGKGTPQKKKKIIRFQNPAQFQECVLELQKMKNSLSNLSAVRPIGMIHAISCPLQSTQIEEHFESLLSLEDDIHINLHSYIFNPMNPNFNRNSLKEFDISQSIPWGVKKIKAPQVWKKATGRKINIGVVDTGVDYAHPDLRLSLGRGINLLNRLLPPVDDNGHGTHIAGTIAASNKINGIRGVAPGAVIHPVKAFDYNGSAFVSDIIMGIDWCVNNRMDIINMSFGMKHRSQSLFDAVLGAYNAGIVIVSSSGNDSKRFNVDYPARFQETIAVGATDTDDKIASFSNRGKQIDVYAPGEKIFSTWTGGKYNELSGTSMATSHVTGLIALLLSSRPNLSPKTVKLILKKSSVPIKSSKYKNKVLRKGIVNAVQMFKLLRARRKRKKPGLSIPGLV